MNDLITVIVPVYNVEKYIKKCICSILHQSYGNLEIIVVDDGSTDESGKICDKLSGMDTRIHIIHKTNEGLAETRNVGLRVAQGKYIIFVDGDDYIEKNMIGKLYERMLWDDSDLVLCNIHFVDESGNTIVALEKELTDNVWGQKEFWAGFYGSFQTPYVVAWNKLYKKELFKHVKFEKGKVHEDEFIIHQIISQCRSITVINDKLYYYVQRLGSIMGRGYNITRLQAFEALNIRLGYFYTNDVTYIEPTMSSMRGVLVRASVNLDLSNYDNKYRLRECIQMYWKRVLQCCRYMNFRSVAKSIAFLYFRPIYLLLKKKAYING